jgi:hypothetical protein
MTCEQAVKKEKSQIEKCPITDKHCEICGGSLRQMSLLPDSGFNYLISSQLQCSNCGHVEFNMHSQNQNRDA